MRWEADEAIPMQVIAALVPNSIFTNIKGHNTAKDVWDTLKALYEGCTTMVLVNLSQQLQSQHCRDDKNVCKHFDKLANLHKQLGAMGKSIPNNEYASILMGSLPSIYYGMLGAIAASVEMSRAAVSPAVVIKLATDEFDHQSIQSEKGEEAYTTDTQKSKTHKGKCRNIECENCQKSSHTKAQCWAKEGGNEGGGPK